MKHSRAMKVSSANIWFFLGCLLMLCSCATENAGHPGLPAEVSMNPEAGRGGWLIVTLRLAGGEALPVLLDTGCPVVSFDKSLEPKLGQRLDTGTFWNFGVSNETCTYPMPKLYLGKARLQAGSTNVFTFNCQPLSADAGRPIMGILGMDVLKHYCLQLDFAAGKLRFLDDEHTDKSGWGRPFALADIGDGCVFIRENLVGATDVGSMIDTGCDHDGWLVPELYQQWTNQTSTAGDQLAHGTSGILGGEIYPGIDLDVLDAKLLASDDSHIKLNGIGLPILARNLVTFDFPHNTMYLKRTSTSFPADEHMQTVAKAEAKLALKFLKHLAAEGELPGWSKTDELATELVDFNFHFPAVVTFDHLLKKGNATDVYHFKVMRTYPEGSWKLLQAWRKDEQGHRIEEYPVP